MSLFSRFKKIMIICFKMWVKNSVLINIHSLSRYVYNLKADTLKTAKIERFQNQVRPTYNIMPSK